MNGKYRRCETCGNKKCSENIVAIYYDDCVMNNYSMWSPNYVWLGMDRMSPEEVDEICRQMDEVIGMAEK